MGSAGHDHVNGKWEIVMKTWLFVLSVAASVALLLTPAMAEEKREEKAAATFVVQPVGHVQKADGRTVIVLDKKYQPGLLGLGQWSHVQVIWWFDKNDTPEIPSMRSTTKIE